MAVLLNPLIPDRLKIPETGEFPELEYYRCQLRAPGGEDFLFEKGTNAPKARIYFHIKGERDWRVGEEPHQIRGVFPVMALANVVIFVGTLIIRVAQTIIILTGAFFRAHEVTFEETENPEFSAILFQELEQQLGKQKGDLYNVGCNIQRDGKCFAAMEIAATLGTFTTNPRKIVHMQIVWGAMEWEWNGERSYTDSSVAKVSRWLKHHSTSKMSLEEQMSHISRLVGEANGAFYLLECAQIRSQDLAERLAPVGAAYPSYAALAEAIRKQAEVLGKK